MELLLFTAVLLLLIACFPYFRIFVKRLLMRHKLRSVCRRKEFALIPAHRLWLFGSRNGRRCDFYIDTPNAVYAVKLFGILRHTNKLVFQRDGRYVIRRHIAFISSIAMSIVYPIDSDSKAFPPYNFRYRYRNEWYLKAHRSVLLLSPTCMEVRVATSTGEKVIGNRETFADMTLFSLSGLIGELEITA